MVPTGPWWVPRRSTSPRHPLPAAHHRPFDQRRPRVEFSTVAGVSCGAARPLRRRCRRLGGHHGIPLAIEVSRALGLDDYVILQKTPKIHLADAIAEPVKSITTGAPQRLLFDRARSPRSPAGASAWSTTSSRPGRRSAPPSASAQCRGPARRHRHHADRGSQWRHALGDDARLVHSLGAIPLFDPTRPASSKRTGTGPTPSRSRPRPGLSRRSEPGEGVGLGRHPLRGLGVDRSRVDSMAAKMSLGDPALARRAPGRRPAARFVGRPGEVGGVKPSVRAAISFGSPAGTKSTASSARPPRRERRWDDEIETAWPQQGEVDGGDRVRGHDHQPPRAALEGRDGLQELVDNGLVVRSLARSDAISSASSMKQTMRSTRRSSSSVCAGRPRRPRPDRAARGAARRTPTRVATRWTARTRSCPSRGPEQHDGGRRGQLEAVGKIRVGEGSTTRRSKSSFVEEKALHRLPEPRLGEATAVALDGRQFLGDHRGIAHVEVQPVEMGEALIGERQLADLAGVHEGNQPGGTLVDDLLVEARAATSRFPVGARTVEREGEQVGVRAADASDDRSHQGARRRDRDAGRLVLGECLDDVTAAVGAPVAIPASSMSSTTSSKDKVASR